MGHRATTAATRREPTRTGTPNSPPPAPVQVSIAIPASRTRDPITVANPDPILRTVESGPASAEQRSIRLVCSESAAKASTFRTASRSCSSSRATTTRVAAALGAPSEIRSRGGDRTSPLSLPSIAARRSGGVALRRRRKSRSSRSASRVRPVLRSASTHISRARAWRRGVRATRAAVLTSLRHCCARTRSPASIRTRKWADKAITRTNRWPDASARVSRSRARRPAANTSPRAISTRIDVAPTNAASS